MLRLIDFYFYDSLRYLGGGGGGGHTLKRNLLTHALTLIINIRFACRQKVDRYAVKNQKHFQRDQKRVKDKMKSQKELASAVNQQTQFPCY